MSKAPPMDAWMWERSHIVCMIFEVFSPNRMKLRVANLYWERMRQSGISSGADLMKLSEDNCAIILGLHNDQRPLLFGKLRELEARSRGYGAWRATQEIAHWIVCRNWEPLVNILFQLLVLLLSKFVTGFIYVALTLFNQDLEFLDARVVWQV